MSKFEEVKEAVLKKAEVVRILGKENTPKLTGDEILNTFKIVREAVEAEEITLKEANELIELFTEKSRFLRLKPDDKVIVKGHGRHHVSGTGPEGGRNKTGGTWHKTPWAFFVPACTVISDPPRPSGFENAPMLELGEEFEIVGYGIHVLEYERWCNSEVIVVRVSDGFKSIVR